MDITFDWNDEKNNTLRISRGIGFEEIIEAMENGDLLDVIDHPNFEKYKNQKIYVVEINDYVYLVPFLRDENKIFLKTIIPNRKATKKYLNK